MNHPRKDIRDAVVALLTGATSAGSRVYPSRFAPVSESELPCLLVYTLSEDVEISSESPREYGRSLKLIVDIRAAAAASLDNTFDALALQVESAMMQDFTLGDRVNDIILQNTEISVSVEGDAEIGSCALTYLLPYFTLAVTSPTEANHVNDLKTINTKFDQPNYPSGDIDAESTITFTF